jgi:hypothetical protein
VIWTAVLIILLIGTLFHPGMTAQSRNVLDLVHGSKSVLKEITSVTEDTPLRIQDSLDKELSKQENTHQIEVDVEGSVATEDVSEGEEHNNHQKEDTGQEGKVDPHGPKWLKYKQ